MTYLENFAVNCFGVVHGKVLGIVSFGVVDGVVHGIVAPNCLSCLPIEVESPLDALPVNHIPELLTSDCLPPFPVEAPVGYFRAWLRRLFRRRAPPRPA